MLTIFLLFPLFSVGFTQQLISLSSFKGDGQKNRLLHPTPFSIYVSANPDSEDLLSKIYIVNKGAYTDSLYALKLLSNRTGVFDRYVIKKSAYLITNLTTNEMKTLKGVMFISSPKQVQASNFTVIDIGNAKTRLGGGSMYQTILFLNTHVDTDPHNSAVISKWEVRDWVSIYPGFPSDYDEPLNTQIFSNPMQTDKSDKRFPNMEPCSLSLVAFYFKIIRGLYFEIEPGYLTVDKTTIHANMTTGFYMKPLNKTDSLVTINTVRDNRFSGGSAGANIIGNLSNGAKVTVAEYDGVYNDQFSTPPKNTFASWSTPNIGSKLSISSTPGSTGYYYVQYFVDQGRGDPPTTTRPTTSKPESSTLSTVTSTHVETTTGSGTNQVFISLIISFMVFFMFC